ncbi:MAG: hypothetical protein ACXU9U_02250 [Parachlamydiaceae bacterium]
MASDQILDNYLTWGEDAQVVVTAPQQYRPGAIGSVCGIHVITSPSVAKEFCQALGSKFYSIEFGDGSSIEIPEVYLEKYQEK